jgi:hypothetical protein
VIINFPKKDRPEEGKVYCLSAMMGKGKSWADAEIKPSGLPLGLVVTYWDMANPEAEAVLFEEVGGIYGQKCVFLESGRESTVSKQSIDGPGGWKTKGRVLSTDELIDAVNKARANRVRLDAEAKVKADDKAAKDAETKARILGDYPYLEARATSKKSDHALAAANLKRELARMFPGVKFSIRSESYSMGCSVNVDWTDGPLTEKVQAVCNKYRDHDFDGMTDSTSYEPTNWTETFGNANHVMANRHESAALLQEASDALGWGPLELDKWDCITNMDQDKGQTVYREARKIDKF